MSGRQSRRQVRRRDFSSRPWDPIRHNESVALRKRFRRVSRAAGKASRGLRRLQRAFVNIGVLHSGGFRDRGER